MSENMITALKEMPSTLKERAWKGGVLVRIQGAMRAPIKNGSITLESGWRADIYLDGRSKRKADTTLIADDVPTLLRDLAAICSGEFSPQEAQP